MKRRHCGGGSGADSDSDSDTEYVPFRAKGMLTARGGAGTAERRRLSRLRRVSSSSDSEQEDRDDAARLIRFKALQNAQRPMPDSDSEGAQPAANHGQRPVLRPGPSHDAAECNWPQDKPICCGLMCSAKWSSEAVAALRKCGGPSVQGDVRRAWHLTRYTSGPPGKRGAEYLLDTPILFQGEYVPLARFDKRHGVRTCAKFYRFATGASNSFVSGLSEVRVPRLAAPRLGEGAAKDVHAGAWVGDLGDQYQQQPDSDLQLLPFPTKGDVFKLYEVDCKRQGVLCCVESYFNASWRARAPHVKIRKHLKFAKCSTTSMNATMPENSHLAQKFDSRRQAELVVCAIHDIVDTQA